MSAIALPFVKTNNAVTANRVNIERTVEYYPQDIPNPGQGVNPPDPARYSGYPQFWIIFKVAINQRTGTVNEVKWVYSDATTRDADLTALDALVSSTL